MGLSLDGLALVPGLRRFWAYRAPGVRRQTGSHSIFAGSGRECRRGSPAGHSPSAWRDEARQAGTRGSRHRSFDPAAFVWHASAPADQVVYRLVRLAEVGRDSPDAGQRVTEPRRERPEDPDSGLAQPDAGLGVGD